jgi:hypothetical protein
LLDGIHRLADPDLGREVDDAVDAAERTGNHVPVADVACYELGLAWKVLGTIAVAVDLLDQAVEHAHLISAAKKLTCDGAPDKPGTPRD